MKPADRIGSGFTLICRIVMKKQLRIDSFGERGTELLSSSNSIMAWGKWILAIALFVALCVGATYYLAKFDIFSVTESILIIAVVGFGAFLTYRQITIAKHVKQFNAQVWDIAEYEKGMDQQITRLINQSHQSTSQTTAALKERDDAIEKGFRSFDTRLKHLEASSRAAPQGKTKKDDHAAKVVQSVKATENMAKAAADPNDTRIATALEGDKLVLHLQPIVELPSRNPAFFETAMRLQVKKEKFMDANEFDHLAESGGVKAAIDIKMLYTSVRMLRTLNALNKNSGIFCGLSRKTLNQTKSFDTFFDYLQANIRIKSELVLNINQADLASLNKNEKSRLNKIADLGFALSLSRIHDVKIDAKTLAAQGFHFVKIAAPLLLKTGTKNDQDHATAQQLINQLEENGVALIATEIDKENDAIDMIDLNSPFAQGNHFAPPRPVKPELLGD